MLVLEALVFEAERAVEIHGGGLVQIFESEVDKLVGKNEDEEGSGEDDKITLFHFYGQANAEWQNSVHEQKCGKTEGGNTDQTDKAVDAADLPDAVIVIPISGTIADCINKPAGEKLEGAGDDDGSEKNGPRVFSDFPGEGNDEESAESVNVHPGKEVAAFHVDFAFFEPGEEKFVDQTDKAGDDKD